MLQSEYTCRLLDMYMSWKDATTLLTLSLPLGSNTSYRVLQKESAKTKSPRIRLPITTEIMQQIKNLLTKQPTTYQSTML